MQVIAESPSIPFGIDALGYNFRLITYPRGVRHLLHAADGHGLKFDYGHATTFDKVLMLSKDTWVDVLKHVSSQRWPSTVPSHWAVWGLNWIVVDNEDIQPIITDHIRMAMESIDEEGALRITMANEYIVRKNAKTNILSESSIP